MGSGGLNGHIREPTQPERSDSVFRYEVNVNGRETSSHFSERSSQQSSGVHQATNERRVFGADGSHEEMVCKRCSNRLSFFNKKNLCHRCHGTFCTSCYVLGCKQNEKSSWCFSCRALQHPTRYRECLIELKVKELQGYLRTWNVPMFHCTEKKELVDLVLFHAEGRMQPQSAPTMPTQPNNHRDTRAQVPQSSGGPAARDSSRNSAPAQKTSKPVRTLSTLGDIGDISSLSVKELKYILTANYVDFRGCCEKGELLDRARILWKSKHDKGSKDTSGQQGDDGINGDQCKICMDSHIDCVLLECGHMVTCIPCGKQLKECPICRQYISRIVHVFKS